MQTRYYIEGYTKPILDQLRSAGAKFDPAVKKWYTYSQDIANQLQSALNKTNQQTQAPAQPGQVHSATEKACRCGAIADIHATRLPMCCECYAKEAIRSNASQMQPDKESKHWSAVSQWAFSA